MPQLQAKLLRLVLSIGAICTFQMQTVAINGDEDAFVLISMTYKQIYSDLWESLGKTTNIGYS